MANFFVDFTLSTNGDGSSSSPWNQFTSTESANVSDGDYIWFRRCSTTSKINFTSGNIYYIGWPMSTDEFYSIRPTGMLSWDNDTDEYVELQESSYTTWVCDTIQSNNVIQRFKFIHMYNNYNGYAGCIKCNSISNVVLKYCLFETLHGYLYGTGCLINFDNCSDIEINYSTMITNRSSAKSYEALNMLYINNSSNIKINDTNYYLGDYNNTNINKSIYSSSISKILNSTVYLNNTNLYLMYYINATSTTILGLIYVDNSYVYTNNINIELKNNYTNTKSYSHDTDCLIELANSSMLKIVDSYINSSTNKGSLFYSHTNSTLNIYNTTINNKDILHNTYFITATDSTNTTMSGCTIYADDKFDVETKQFFRFDNPVNYINNLNFIDTTVSGNITIGTYNCTEDKFIINSEFNKFNGNASIQLPAKKNIIIENADIVSLILNVSDYPINIPNSSISKTTQLTLNNIKFSNIYGVYLVDNSRTKNNEFIDITLNNCYNVQTLLNTDNLTSQYEAIYLTTKNCDYINIGALSSETDLYSRNLLDTNIQNSMLINNPNYSIATSTVYRTNGANYSIKCFLYNNIVNFMYCPELCDNTLWIYVPNQGTYTITAYILSTSELTNGNIQFIVELNEGTYYPSIGETITQDTSTWNNTTATYTYKISTQITCLYEQYIPIRFKIQNLPINNTIYIDPKVIIV